MSDHIEHRCTKCGSLLHTADRCDFGEVLDKAGRIVSELTSTATSEVLNPRAVFDGSDAGLTIRFYQVLTEKCGPIGIVAMNLFRAQKASTRAKEYGRRFKGVAYDKKGWSLDNACMVLTQRAGELSLAWGWKVDEGCFHPWVLYVDLPTGQVSFHAPTRGLGPDYTGEWDGERKSGERIIQWTEQVLRESGMTVEVGVARKVTHLLSAGQTPCGMQGLPKDWPEGHVWAGFADVAQVNCEECLEALEKTRR